MISLLYLGRNNIYPTLVVIISWDSVVLWFRVVISWVDCSEVVSIVEIRLFWRCCPNWDLSGIIYGHEGGR